MPSQLDFVALTLAMLPLHIVCVGTFALFAGDDLGELRRGRFTSKMLLGLMIVVCLEFSVWGAVIRHAQVP